MDNITSERYRPGGGGEGVLPPGYQLSRDKIPLSEPGTFASEMLVNGYEGFLKKNRVRLQMIKKKVVGPTKTRTNLHVSVCSCDEEASAFRKLSLYFIFYVFEVGCIGDSTRN